jgi:hypothetical protein
MYLPDRTDSIFKCLWMGAIPPSFQIKRMVPQMMATMAVNTLVKRAQKKEVGGDA